MEPGYEYDDETEGMRDAIDRARANPRPSPSPEDVLKRFDDVAAKWDAPSTDDTGPAREMEGLDLSVGGADSPEGQLKDAFDRAGRAPNEGPEGVHGPEDVGGDPSLDEKPVRPSEAWAGLKFDLEQSEKSAPPADQPLIAKMRSVGWDPRPAAKSMQAPDWEGLQRDVAAAERSADRTRLVDRVLSDASPDHSLHADPNLGAGAIAAAKEPLEVAKARQQYEREDTSQALAQARMSAQQQAAGDMSTLRQAEAAKWRDDNARARDAADAKQRTETEKRAAAASLREADATSLTSAKALWLKTSPYAQEHQLAADDLTGIASRKDWEDFVRTAQVATARGAKASSGKGATSGPVEPLTKLPDIKDPGDRAIVQAIIEGRAGPNSVSRKDATRILKLVAQVKPDFDASAFSTYEGVKKHLAQSGDVVALNTAFAHLARAEKNIPDSFDAQALNRIRQAVLTGSGSDTLTGFETDVKIAADELAKAYGNNTEAGRQAVEHLLDPKQSPAQLRMRLAEARELLGGKLDAYQHQLDAVAPKGGARFNIRPPAAVKLKFPNGKVLDVPAGDVDEAKTKFKAVEAQ